ncbi:MAG: arginyltransferase [Nitrospirota bacterium]
MKQKMEPPVSHQSTSICPYFNDGRLSTIEYVVPGHNGNKDFHTFLSGGYRRLGPIFYRNVCENCFSCLPVRLETAKFRASRSQRRSLRMNEDIRVEILSHPHITQEKLALYESYVNSKHPADNADSPGNAVDVLLNIHYGYPDTIEMNYFSGDRLIAVGIVDAAHDSLSSNYFYYDTSCLDRRPGVFSILREISLASAMGKKYYYLGFYIGENPKMSYKIHFRPNQMLTDGVWKDYPAD